MQQKQVKTGCCDHCSRIHSTAAIGGAKKEKRPADMTRHAFWMCCELTQLEEDQFLYSKVFESEIAQCGQ